MLRKSVLIFGLLLSLGFIWAQVPIFYECVNPFDEVPAGWTVNDGGGLAIYQNGGGGYLLADHIDDWVTTSAYDLGNYSSVELSLMVATYGTGGNNPLTIDLSVDNGATWSQTFISETPSSSTYIDSGVFAINSDSSQVKFRFRRDAEEGRGVRFRRILLEGTPSAPIPTLAVNPAQLSGFNYTLGEGPSPSQSFEVSGEDLDGTVLIFAPEHYQISLSENTGFAASLVLGSGAGTLDTTAVYVRLIADLEVGAYNNELVQISAGSAVPKTVSLGGHVSAEPFEGGYFVDFEGANEVKTGYASGTVNLSGLDWDMTESLIGNLDADFKNGTKSARLNGKTGSSMTMLEDKAEGLGVLSFLYRTYSAETQVSWMVEYSTDQGISWYQVGEEFTATTTVQEFSEIVNVPGGVRIRISTDNVGTQNRRLNIDDILLTDFTGGGGDPVIHVTGEIDPLYNIMGLPSDELGEYYLAGENLVANIQISAPDHFEIATSDSGPWHRQMQVPAYFEGNMYVRIHSEVLGEHSGDILHSSGNAASVSIRVEGETLMPDGEIHITNNMQRFSQTYGSPSAPQSYQLSGTNLNGNTEINCPAPFEISLSETEGWAQNLSVPSDFASNIYVRLNGTDTGEYDESAIEHINPSAQPVNLFVYGTILPTPSQNLFFSEYIEGSSNNKALEIYNASGMEVDLSEYKICLYSNGASEPTNTLIPSVSLAAGAVYVIANEGAMQDILDLADITSTVTYFNGDDALALIHIPSGEIIDVFGTIGFDPGTAWDVAGIIEATLDHTLIRKPSVLTGEPDWALQVGTDATDSQWIVMPMNYIENLGYHDYAGAGDYTATPSIEPAGGSFLEPVLVSISCDTPNANIYYSIDGSTPSAETGTLYTQPFTISESLTLRAIAYAAGYEPSFVATAAYSFPVPVANIAALRNLPTGANNVYTLTGEAILTYQNANRGTKYIQDATAAIVIDDYSGIITTQYQLYDGITGITGTLNLYSQLLQFVPVLNSPAASSTGNIITPEMRTLASLTSADQAKLIRVNNLEFSAQTNPDFTANAQNINVSDPSGSVTLRTFPNTDYAGTPIPTEAVDLICLVGQFNNAMQIGPRFLADFLTIGGDDELQIPVVQIEQDSDQIYLYWELVPGASSYRIEASNLPDSGFSQIGIVYEPSFDTSADSARKFFRVIALP